MGMDWFIKVEGSHPGNESNGEGEIIKNCSDCP